MNDLAKLVRNEQDRLYRLFLSKTGDPQESVDLLQDLYLSVLKRLDSFSLAEDQAAWLFRAAHNRVVDWYRKRSRKREVSLDAGGTDDDEDSLIDVLASADLDLEDSLIRESLYEALELAVESLPYNLRLLIREQTLGGRTFQELSGEWHIPVGTLLSRKREAIRLLKEALADFADVWHEMSN